MPVLEHAAYPRFRNAATLTPRRPPGRWPASPLATRARVERRRGLRGDDARNRWLFLDGLDGGVPPPRRCGARGLAILTTAAGAPRGLRTSPIAPLRKCAEVGARNPLLPPPRAGRRPIGGEVPRHELRRTAASLIVGGGVPGWSCRKFSITSKPASRPSTTGTAMTPRSGRARLLGKLPGADRERCRAGEGPRLRRAVSSARLAMPVLAYNGQAERG